jgi:hypothetical protein
VAVPVLLSPPVPTPGSLALPNIAPDAVIVIVAAPELALVPVAVLVIMVVPATVPPRSPSLLRPRFPFRPMLMPMVMPEGPLLDRTVRVPTGCRGTRHAERPV